MPNPNISSDPDLSSNPDLSDGIFEDVPYVNQIDFGFYAVPTKDDMVGFMMSVDSELIAPHHHGNISGYISSEVYLSNHLPKMKPDPYSETSSMLSVYDEPVKTSGDYYEKVNSFCSLYPYKDPIRWKINPLSKEEFPNNVEVYNDNDLM